MSILILWNNQKKLFKKFQSSCNNQINKPAVSSEKQEKTHDHVQVSRQQPVFEDAPIRNVDPLALVGNDDDSSTKGDVASKVDVAGDR
jgi:hypothetical protein